MKHKYVLSKDNGNGEFLIKEYAELNKDIFSPVCESVYETNQVESAVKAGHGAVIAKMRAQNFFPPIGFSEKIARGVIDLVSSTEQNMVEVYCDDCEHLNVDQDDSESIEKIEDNEDENLDEFIEDDLPDDFESDVKPNKVNSSIDLEEDDLDDEDN